MTWDITACVATRPQTLVGYWGGAEPTGVAADLQRLLAQSGETDWAIASQPSPDGTLAVRSATGLGDQAQADPALVDIWVRVAANHLSLGRQAFGRLTLYWMAVDQGIWFASRLQLLRPLVAAPRVNRAALYGYSCLSYVPTPLSPLEGIGAIAAGTEQRWQIDGAGRLVALPPNPQVDWQEEADPIAEESEAIAQLQTHLKAAVARHIADLRQGDTVAVALSGGLDSSIVAALLVQMGVKVRAYTLDFGPPGAYGSLPEVAYAEQVAQALNIPLVKVDASPQRIRAAIRPTLRALDLPFGDGVTVPLFLLYQAARQDTRILFNGEGGDQLFAGWTNKPLIAAGVYQSQHPRGEESFAQQYLRTFHRLWGYESQVFQPDRWASLQSIHPETWLYPALEGTARRSLLHRLRRASLMLKGAQNIQPRATNLAIAHGLQVRSPFCDLPLAQWTFRLSGDLCLQGACEKYILKRAVEGWLPPDIVWRSKRGMGVPLTAWCLQNWWCDLGGWLNPGILRAEGDWQPDVAARVALGQLGGLMQGRRIGEILWLLIVWQQWRSQVLGGPLAPSSWRHPFWLPYPFWRFSNRWR